MKSAYIKAIDYYLPERIVSNQDIASWFPDWTAEKVQSKVGIIERHVSAIDETACDMAYQAAEKLFSIVPECRQSVDFLLLCTQSPDYKLPATACILQDRLGLSQNCGALDFNLGCSGYEYGLGMAKGLICSNIANNVLLITSETYTKYIHPKDKGNLTIFGDGAAATLVSTDGFAKIGEFVFGTDGNGANNLIVKSGGARQTTQIECVSDDVGYFGDNYLYMNGGAIFDFSSEVVPSMIEKLLNISKLSLDLVNLWIFHQANKYMMNYLRKLVGIEKEKFYVHMEKIGNTVSSTIPIALSEALKENKLHGNVCLIGFGVGLSWGGTILEIQDDAINHHNKLQ